MCFGLLESIFFAGYNLFPALFDHAQLQISLHHVSETPFSFACAQKSSKIGIEQSWKGGEGPERWELAKEMQQG